MARSNIAIWLPWRIDGLRKTNTEGAKRLKLFRLIPSPPITNQVPHLICRIFGLNLAKHREASGSERHLRQATRGSVLPARTSGGEYRTVKEGKTRLTNGVRPLQRTTAIR